MAKNNFKNFSKILRALMYLVIWDEKKEQTLVKKKVTTSDKGNGQ